MKRFDIKKWKEGNVNEALAGKVRKDINKELSLITQGIEKIIMLTNDNIDDGKVTSSNINLASEQFIDKVKKILGKV
jgi:hypothetical protein